MSLQPLAALAAGLALGAMVFFSFAMAPLVFRVLGTDMAAAFMRAAFPRYYKWLAVLTVAAAALAAIAAPGIEAVALAAVAFVFVLALVTILPRVNRLREFKIAGDAGAERAFARLHRLSVFLNLIQLVVLLAVFLRLTA